MTKNKERGPEELGGSPGNQGGSKSVQGDVGLVPRGKKKGGGSPEGTGEKKNLKAQKSMEKTEAEYSSKGRGGIR